MRTHPQFPTAQHAPVLSKRMWWPCSSASSRGFGQAHRAWPVVKGSALRRRAAADPRSREDEASFIIA